MKKIILFALLCLSAVGSYAQGVRPGFDLANYGVKIEPDKRVMIVLATIEAARTTDAAGNSVPVLNTPLSAEGLKFREQLNSDLAALNPELRSKITQFLIQHKSRNSKKTDAQIVAPFISMAYALTPAPELADPIVTSDLPGSLLDVLDFAPLVRDFYRRSSFSGNINEYIKSYQRASEGQLRNSAGEMVTDLLNYLHTKPQLYFTERVKVETQKTRSKKATLSNVELRQRERRFFIVPEMLAPTGTINFLNVKDDYYVVLPPNSDLSFSDVRRAYLQFVIDPIVLSYQKEIASVRDGIKLLLDEQRKTNTGVSPDVYLTISRSLVAAVDAKQIEEAKIRITTAQAREKIGTLKTDAEKKAFSDDLNKFKQSLADETALRLSEDYDKGAVLVFYFADQIKGLEDSQFDIASSMREMILALDPAKESGRYAQFADARKRALDARASRSKTPDSQSFSVENPLVTRLLEIKPIIDAGKYPQAQAELKQLLDKYPAEPRIFYNIGRVASLSAQAIDDEDQQKAKLLEAKVAYENVIRIAEKEAIDPALLSLSYVALAKIYEFYDEKGFAIALYDKALRLTAVTGGAYNEALAAKQRLIKEQ